MQWQGTHLKISMLNERSQAKKQWGYTVHMYTVHCMTLFIQNSRKYKLISSNRREISSCLGTWGAGGRCSREGERERLQQGTRKLLGETYAQYPD